jgi:ribonuclease HII
MDVPSNPEPDGRQLAFPDLDEPSGPWRLEKDLWDRGFRLVAGVDEAGRGPLAGPVVAAAVILNREHQYPFVADSKTLKPRDRDLAFHLVMRRARSVGWAMANNHEIDQTNILAASLQAMARAVDTLDAPPDFVLVDGNCRAPLAMQQRTVVGGDGLSLSIGAASIVAKVVRDRIMIAYDQLYPQYGFASHKGYGTKKHLAALSEHGPCPIHRVSFKGVARPS